MFNPFMSGLGMFGGYGGYRPPMPPMFNSFGRPPMMGGFGGFGGYGSPFGGLGMFGMSPYGGMPNYGMFGGMMNPFMNRPPQQLSPANVPTTQTTTNQQQSSSPFNYGKDEAEMRMTQRDLKSAEEQAYINKVLGINHPIRTDTNPNLTFTNELPQQPTDLMAGFRSSEFALPSNAIRDMAMGNVGLADGRNFRFGSMAEAGAFKQYLDSIGQEYNNNSNPFMIKDSGISRDV